MTKNTPLKLERDRSIKALSLAQYLDRWSGTDLHLKALANILLTIANESTAVAMRLAQGFLPGDPTAAAGSNQSGDQQKALDIGAHHHFVNAFATLNVAKVLSEEAQEVQNINPSGRFDVAMDPIDGSGSIGIGAPLGGLFAIFPAGDSFLRPGRDILAAAYLSFGHSLDFGFSVGQGVVIATFDPEKGAFFIDNPRVQIQPDTKTIAFNASYLRRWGPGYRHYVSDLVSGAQGRRGRDFNMRWIAAAVGDLHRILRRGGVFMYPADTRQGYENGFLRLAYEAFPIAFLIEQAGGRATDGVCRILDLQPGHLHDRVPLVFGSRAEVDTIAEYITKTKENEHGPYHSSPTARPCC